MVFKPSTPSVKVKPEYVRRANKAVGRTVMPKKDTAVGRVLKQKDTSPGTYVDPKSKKIKKFARQYKS